MWTAQRIVFALLTALGGTLASAATFDGLSPKVAIWIVLAAGTINGFLRVLEAPEPKP